MSIWLERQCPVMGCESWTWCGRKCRAILECISDKDIVETAYLYQLAVELGGFNGSAVSEGLDDTLTLRIADAADAAAPARKRGRPPGKRSPA
jgi:hypothetical protein